jgi:ArsR family transcriptional regulator, arsenate/arsenite/antimonite-responsive transcriptional repressor
MSEKLLTTDHEQLARIAKALGHPVRVFIMELLAAQSCCFSGDLAEDLPIARSTLSQHLKELKSAGLIQGTIEYPKIRYCINRENWARARQLFGNLLNPDLPQSAECISNPGFQPGA